MANINFLNGQAITGNVTIATSGLTDNLILTSTDTSSASAPDIVLYRNAAIADSDTLGVVEYKGKNGMVPSSGNPLTYNAIYSRIADASNNQSILTLSAHKGNGSGSFIHAVNVSAIGTNNSATGAILINPLTDFSLPAYNLDVNGTAYISNTLLINGELSLDNITNASSDTDKFVVADNGVIKYRTGAQVRSDIGAGTGSGNVSNTGTPADNQIAIWTNATTIEGDSDLTFNGTDLTLGSGKINMANNKAVSWANSSVRGEGNILKLTATTTIQNQQNTQIYFDGGGAPVSLDIHNAGTATGDDAKITFETQAAMDYAIGIDKSDSNKFKISRSQDFGTNDVFSLASGSAVIADALTLSTIDAIGSDTDKFLMSDSGVVKYVTGANLRSYIGAGTGSGSVTSIATTSPIQGGTITGSGTISITTATASAIGAGNVAVNGAGSYDGLRLSYSGGTATVGLDPDSLPNYTGTPGSADLGSISMIIHNNDDVNNINQLLEMGQLQTMINTNNYLSSASFSTGNGVLTLNRSGLSAVTVDLDGRYALSSDVPTVNNSTITIQAGTNLTTGGDFTTNQSSNETIIINMATGGVGAGTYGSTSDSTKIDNITVDAYGRVTGVTTGATGQVDSVQDDGGSTINVSGSSTARTVAAVTGTVSSSSSNLATGAQIQTAINTAITGVLKYDGVWNASTNTPTLSSGSGTVGEYYIVSVAGSTNLDGITDWAVGDWAVFSDQATDAWQKIDNTQVGNVTGSGSSGRVAFWNSDSNITSDSDLTFDGFNLTVGGSVTWTGGGSGESNLAYDRSITSFGDTGTSTITLTIGQQSGNSLSTSFNVPQGTVTSVGTTGSVNGITLTGTVTSSGNLTLGGTLSINNSDWSGTDLSVANGGTGASSASAARTNLGVINDTGTPAILSNGSTPSLNSGISAAEVRTLIGAGTSSSSGVTSVATGNGLTGGTITSTGTVSVDYSTGSDNLIFSANAWGSSVSTAPYTPYILMADSNPGIANDQVEKVQIEDIPMNRFGKPDSSIDMDTNKIINLETPTNSNDAANKSYVDTAVSGAGSGTFLPLAGGTMTGAITDLETTNDLVTGKTGTGNITAKDSNNTFWQVFKSGGGTYMTTAGTSSDSIYLGAPTTSVTTNLTVSGNLQTGNTGDGTLTLKQSGTMFLQMFSQFSTTFINTGSNNSTIYFGNSSGLVQNVNVAGFLDADNFKINNSQGSDGQVMTSTGSGVAWETPSTPGDGQINGATSGLGLSGSMSATANQTGNTTFTVTSNASTAATASTIAYRDGSADISGRLFRANYTDQSTISGAIAFRVNNSSDNYTRYCNSPSAIRAFIGAGTGSGTVTGTGSSGRVAFWNSSTGITSEADFGWSGQTLQIGGNANASEYTIELGKGRTNNGYAYIDLVGDATYTDYGLRIIRGNGGANTSSEIIHRGTSNFTITNQENASFKVQTNGANERFKIRGNGETYFGPDGASTSTLYIDPVGRKVGFRTETPGSAFDVNGTFRARNELNIGATTEQNFFVSGSSPYYVKMGNYTPSNAGNYMGGETNVGLLRSTAGFGTTGKVLMATRLYTTKIETGGWPTSTGSSNGVNVTPTPDNDQVLIVKNIFVHKAGSTIGSGWSTSTYPVEFVQQQQNGVYAILGGVARTVIINGSGAWYYNAHQLYGLSNPQNEALGGLGAPVKLMLNSTLSIQPTWYITVEYSLIDLDIFRNNVDQTLT